MRRLFSALIIVAFCSAAAEGGTECQIFERGPFGTVVANYDTRLMYWTIPISGDREHPNYQTRTLTAVYVLPLGADRGPYPVKSLQFGNPFGFNNVAGNWFFATLDSGEQIRLAHGAEPVTYDGAFVPAFEKAHSIALDVIGPDGSSRWHIVHELTVPDRRDAMNALARVAATARLMTCEPAQIEAL